MLLTHRHAFIYLKTIKTAGTSVEIYFERACLPEDHGYEELHFRNALVTEAGVIGQRGGVATDEWYNHMPASMVRDKVGPIWDRYLKFCCVRDPYDKVVSAFWMQIGDAEREALITAPFSKVQERFEAWVAISDLGRDRYIYTIDGQPVVDDVIRYETLTEDLRRICERTGVPYEPWRLGRYKGEYRQRPEPAEAYYGAESLAIVGEAYDREFEWFSYNRR